MPIYAYRCESCGHAKDVLQKMSDPVLTVCPACGADRFRKQLTAAGFQLKGSGWYVTDFRGGNNNAPPPEAKAPEASEGGRGGAASSSDAGGTGVGAAPASGSTTPSPSGAGGEGCGGSCACH